MKKTLVVRAMQFKLLVGLMLVLACLSSAAGQRKEPGSEAELKAISERGRMLWEYGKINYIMPAEKFFKQKEPE